MSEQRIAAYNRRRVNLASASGGLRDVIDRLAQVMSNVPSGETHQQLLDAKNSLSQARDSIDLELRR